MPFEATRDQVMRAKRFAAAHNGYPCPHCSQAHLKTVMRRGVVVSRCPKCGGEVVTEDEYKRIKKGR